MLDSGSEEDENDHESQLSSKSAVLLPSSSTPTSGKNLGTHPKSKDLMEKLSQQQDSEKLQSKICDMLDGADAVTSSRAVWESWLTSMMPCLNEQVLHTFFRQSL